MPLTKTGKKVKRAFMKEYGNKWESIFYAYENKNKKNKKGKMLIKKMAKASKRK